MEQVSESEGGVLFFFPIHGCPFFLLVTFLSLKLKSEDISDTTSGNFGENESWLAVPVESPLTTTLLLPLFDELRKSFENCGVETLFPDPPPI